MKTLSPCLDLPRPWMPLSLCDVVNPRRLLSSRGIGPLAVALCFLEEDDRGVPCNPIPQYHRY